MIETSATTVTYLFSDIEGSTKLWEVDRDCAARTVAWHDEISRSAVERHRGTVVKTTGDGVHAVFDDPADAVASVIDLQLALAEPAGSRAPLKVRCGLHLGADQRRDSDFFGPAVNRAARIMSAAHGGQVLVSGAVADRVAGRLPQDVVLRDLGAVRLRDLGSPEHVYQLIHPALRMEFPPLRSMASTPNNLPQQVNSFVGRDHDMAQVQQLLANSHLLTLLGMGGLGKSRLSVQVAAVALDNYPDGVWFVELAALSDPRLVPQALASVLGVKEEPGGTVMDAVAQFVRDKQLLVVLDNCEHVVQACAELAKRLLEVGPKVKVLASSRDSLRIAGEIVFPVAPLAAPKKDEMPSADALMTIDSVQLFIDRARAVQPAFRLSEGSVRAVADICRRLDGIPLAIELAAARVRAMSVEQIAARLDDRFRLLNRGDRTAFPRQQTLRALIDWSHDLLDTNERTLFRRLAVFAGGWTLEAVEDVTVGGDIERAEVLELLSNLVEKSLVVIDHETGRYQLLETVRQYAHEKLAEAGEESTIRRRHLDHFVAFTESVGPGLAGHEQQTLLKKVDADRENILSAHSFCVAVGDAIENGYRLVHAIKHYWFIRGLLNLGHRVTVEVLTVPNSGNVALPRCRALWVGGQISTFMGRHEEARRYLEEGLRLARGLDEPRMIVAILNILSVVALGQGDREAAGAHSEEALELSSQLGNARGTAVACNALAQLRRLDGDLDAAEALYERAALIARDLEDPVLRAVAALNLAMVAIQRGAADRARALLTEVLAIAEETGSRQAGQSALEVCAGLAACALDWERAARFYGAAEHQTGSTGIHRDPADEAFLTPLMSRARSELGDANFARIAAEGGALDYEAVITDARAWLLRMPAGQLGGPSTH